MPIDISEFATPKFTRIKEQHWLGTDSKAKFINYTDYPRSYRGDGGNFPQGGYNPAHNSSKVEKINLKTDEFTLKPR